MPAKMNSERTQAPAKINLKVNYEARPEQFQRYTNRQLKDVMAVIEQRAQSLREFSIEQKVIQ
jgi:hypothetical protein